MNSSIPISAEAIIPVSTSDVSGIPTIALHIPDFEGTATLRFFSNATRTQIGCFRAVMRNGASLSHPEAVAPVLGIFTMIAIAASFATAIYGVNLPVIRTHYAHSISVLVVFDVWQSIFFSGALSLDWPSVCAAWWSNFAWSAGMISAPGITSSLSKFTGTSGNSSQAGGAGSATLNNNGGLMQQIYGRSLDLMSRDSKKSVARGVELASRIYRRAGDATGSDAATGGNYNWAGSPLLTGLPIAGDWSNFEGELSDVSIPIANAFLNGFIWFLILLLILIAGTIAFKFLLEGLSHMKWIEYDRLALFRSHWKSMLGLILLRTAFIAFFMMMTLTLFQFSFGGGAGPIAIAAIVFIIFFIGMLSIAGYACFYRLRFGHYESKPDRVLFRSKKVMKIFPWVSPVRASSVESAAAGGTKPHAGGLPFFKISYIDNDSERQSVHEDQEFNKRFGWLTARFRRSRWWFFAVYLVFQFVRACFVGGARASPQVQVYGLLIVDVIGAVGIVWLSPFEGSRNTALAVYMLSISKVATTGLSVAFLPQFNLARIPTTVIGVIIVVIQGFLAVAVLILIVLGAISSYMSLTRNREEFKPASWDGLRIKYFDHMELKATDKPAPPPPVPEEPKEPYFQVKTVRRAPKIEDEDEDFVGDMSNAATQSHLSLRSVSRANSMQSQFSGFGNAPYGARLHRTSWSSQDFQNWNPKGMEAATSSRGPSRHASGNYTGQSNDTTNSHGPLIRPMSSVNSLKVETPAKELQNRYSSQRVASTKEEA